MHAPPEDVGRRLLVVQKHCADDFGGTPESVLALARLMATIGIETDSMSQEGLLRNVHLLDRLPGRNDQRFDRRVTTSRMIDFSGYAGLFVAGSWNVRALSFVLSARRSGVPTTYAAKGNLCRADFARARDLKKVPYLLAVEWPLVRACDRIVFSSDLERDTAILPNALKRRGVTLAEPYLGDVVTTGPPDSRTGRLAIGFLAEISPRKGLTELVEGFIAWRRREPERNVVLRIAGAPRLGSERYAERVRARVTAARPAGEVEWVGPRRGTDRSAFYRSLDLFAVPSRFESFGLTPLEALWFGVPVVCASRLGVLQYLRTSSAVTVSRDLTPARLADALSQATADLDEGRREARALAGRPLQPFTGDALASAWTSALFARR